MVNTLPMAQEAGTILSISRWLPLQFNQVADYAEALRIRIFLLLILLCILPMAFLLLTLVAVMVLGHPDYWQPTLIVTAITFSQISCLVYFLKSGNINLCSLIYATIIYILVGTATLLTGGWESPVCYFILALPIIACLVVTRITGIIFSLAVLALYTTFFLLHQHGYRTPQLISSEFLPYVSIGMWLTTLSFLVGCLLLFDFTTEDLTRVILHERKQWQRDLDFDELTNTLNQNTFLQKTQNYLEKQKPNKDDIGVIYIQINNLNSINHDFGFDAGDFMLKTSAEQICNVMPEKNSILCRNTADSFVVFIKSIGDIGSFISQLFSLKKALQAHIIFNNEFPITIMFQIGAVISADRNISITELISAAKAQMLDGEKQLYARKTSP